MFYKHLHDPSCDLFMHGEEAPQSKEAQLQAALDAERESLSKRCMCEHEWDADGVLISRSECFYHAEQTTQLATLQAQLEAANILIHKKNCAIGRADTTINELQAQLRQVEALQRERDEIVEIVGCSKAYLIETLRAVMKVYLGKTDLQAALDAEREKVKAEQEQWEIQAREGGRLKDKLTQLQAAGNAMMKALRAMRDNKESWYTTVTPELMNAWDMMKTSLGRATLDATTPAECPDCDGDGAVDSGGTDPNGNPLMRRCGCREKGGNGE